MDQVAKLGCLICGKPAEIHHVRSGVGMSQRAAHIGGTVPLCSDHHRNGGQGVAYHATGGRRWQEIFKTEMEMLEEVQERLQEAI